MEEGADEDLTRLAIRQAFEADDQYSEVVDAADIDQVARLRRLGRTVARELGWKIWTTAKPLDDGSVQVLLVITASTPLRDQVMDTRRRRRMRDALRGL